MKYEAVEQSDLRDIAESLINELHPKSHAVLVALQGELGAGKTTFVQEVADIFGIKDPVTSPTYVIEKIYKLSGEKFDRLVHIDAYRLEGGKELSLLGFEKLLEDPNVVIFLEWPERVEEVLPSDIVTIRFEHKGGDVRDITIEGV